MLNGSKWLSLFSKHYFRLWKYISRGLIKIVLINHPNCRVISWAKLVLQVTPLDRGNDGAFAGGHLWKSVCLQS